MIAIPLFLGWLFLITYGVVLLRASKYRKFGITLTTLLIVPIVLVVSLVWYMDFDKIECLLNANEQSECTVENNWKY